MTVFFICLGALCSALFWVRFADAPVSMAKSVVKTLSVTALGIAAILFGQWALALAFLASALGDYALSREGERYFLLGMAAFAVAHLFYIGLMLPLRVPPYWGGASILLVLFGAVMAMLLWRRAGALRLPVLIYVVIIITMGLTALSLDWKIHGLLIGAALLFVSSDTLLAAELFLLDDGNRAKRWLPFLVWPTYWFAQFGFLMGFAGA